MGWFAAVAVAGLLVSIDAAGQTPVHERSAEASTSGRIAYVRRGATDDLVVVRADRTGMRVLVRRVDADDRPTTAADPLAWSPDGSRLAFTQGLRINVVRADGSGRKPVSGSKDAYYHAGPAWSPDGRRIAFDDIGDGWRDVLVVNADGTGESKLTNSHLRTYSAGLFGGTGWSPDGRQLVFTRGTVLARMRPDGTRWRRIGRVSAENLVGASWSPDGREIAFGTDRAVWIVRPDGSGLRRVSDRGGSPTWSPDGSKLAYDNNGRVYVVGRDGGGLRQVGRVGIGASWSPDGKRIAYTSYRDGHGEIYVADLEGRDIRLTTSRRGQSACCATWSPR